MRLAAALVCLLTAGACTKKNPEFCEASSECDTGYCNLELNRCEDTPDSGSTIDAAIAGIDADVTPRITVTTNGSGTGTVISNPAGINCGTICNAVFPAGTEVTLDTTPDTGSILVDWGGACSGFEPCVLTVDGPTDVSARIDQVGELRWAKRLDVSLEAFALQTVHDADGNILITGHFAGTANLGGDPLSSDSLSYDAFAAKFTPDGEHVWSTRFGSPGDDFATAIAIDAEGNVVIPIAIDAPGFNEIVAPSPTDEWLVVKLSASDGSVVWSKTFTVTGGAAVIRGASSDPGGNVVIGGEHTGTIDFDGDDQLVNGPSEFDIFLAYYGPTGSPIRFVASDSGDDDILDDVLLTSTGNTYLTGSFRGPTLYTDSNHGGQDAFIAALLPTGTLIWDAAIGGTSNDRSYSLAVDDADNVYATGSFRGTADFGDGPVASQGDGDIFVISFDPGGTYRWSTTFGTPGDSFFTDRSVRIAVDSRGHVATTGAVRGPTDFGGGLLPAAAGETFTFYALSLNSADGGHRWSRTLVPEVGPGDEGSFGFGIATTPAGLVTATGLYTGTLMLDGETYPAPGGTFMTVFGP